MNRREFLVVMSGVAALLVFRRYVSASGHVPTAQSGQLPPTAVGWGIPWVIAPSASAKQRVFLPVIHANRGER